MPYNISRVQAWAVIDGVEVDIVSMEFSYTMNAIPMASAVLAAGINVDTLRASAAATLAAGGRVMMPAKLWLEVDSVDTDDGTSLSLNGTFMVFEGYMTFIGTTVSADQLGINAAFTHWLSDLNFSSCLSPQSHPANPGQFIFNAAIPDFDDGGANPGGKHFLMTTLAQTFITADAVLNDLWGQGIKPWFEALVSKDRIVPIFGRNDKPDASVQRALGRFNGDRLPLIAGDLDVQEAARAIAEDISASSLYPNNNHFAAMANVTLWDKLVGDLGPTYMFSVIPGPDWAKVVPYISGLREAWEPAGRGPTIRARDNDMSQLQSNLIREIGGFGLYGGFGAPAGAFVAGVAIPPELSIGGAYRASNTGLIMIKRAPRWCDNIMFPSGLPVGHGIDGKEVAAAMDPAAGAGPDINPLDRFKAGKAFMDRMAHAMYCDEVLKHRTGTIYSPLRFDICPGSNISIQAANSDRDESFFYATVVRVAYQIGAEPANAMVTFSLAHIRNTPENADDRTSVDQHPLYDRVWRGDFLIRPGAGGGGGAAAGGGGGAGAGGVGEGAGGGATGADLLQGGVDPITVA